MIGNGSGLPRYERIKHPHTLTPMSLRPPSVLLVVALLSLLFVGSYAASLDKEAEPAARVGEILSVFVSFSLPVLYTEVLTRSIIP